MKDKTLFILFGCLAILLVGLLFIGSKIQTEEIEKFCKANGSDSGGLASGFSGYCYKYRGNYYERVELVTDDLFKYHIVKNG